MRPLAPAVLAFTLLAGCGPETPPPPDVPLPTDGPNQVVVKVPGMVCETCPGRVREALAGLPWVVPASITPDRATRQVRFAVADRAAFDLAAVQDAIGRKGFKGVTLLAGPTP